MIKDIILYGNPILTKSCAPVAQNEFNDELEEFVLDMIDTLKHHKAAGLSAPQVGVSKRILLINQGTTQPLIFINPAIAEHTMDMETDEEGCLSLPGVVCAVPRLKNLTATYQSIEGIASIGLLTDLEARIFQHELDHLNGKLMTFYLTPVRLGLIQGKLKRINKYRKFMEKNGDILKQIHTTVEETETPNME